MEVKNLAEEKLFKKLQTLDLKIDKNGLQLGCGAIIIAFLAMTISGLMIILGKDKTLWISFGVLVGIPLTIMGIIFLLCSKKLASITRINY